MLLTPRSSVQQTTPTLCWWANHRKNVPQIPADWPATASVQLQHLYLQLSWCWVEQSHTLKQGSAASDLRSNGNPFVFTWITGDFFHYYFQKYNYLKCSTLWNQCLLTIKLSIHFWKEKQSDQRCSFRMVIFPQILFYLVLQCKYWQMLVWDWLTCRQEAQQTEQKSPLP